MGVQRRRHYSEGYYGRRRELTQEQSDLICKSADYETRAELLAAGIASRLSRFIIEEWDIIAESIADLKFLVERHRQFQEEADALSKKLAEEARMLEAGTKVPQ